MAFSIFSIIRCAPAAIGPFDSRNGSETAAKNQGFAGRTATRSKAQGGMRQQSVGSALSSADPMQVTAKIVSLIDTARYRNWPRRLVLYIYAYALWADSLESSGACNGHVNRCTREASVYKSGQSRDELQRSVQPLSPSSRKAKPAAVSVVLPLEQSNATSIDARRFDSYRCVGSGRHGCPRGHRVEERHCCTKCFWRFPSAIAASRTRL